MTDEGYEPTLNEQVFDAIAGLRLCQELVQSTAARIESNKRDIAFHVKEIDEQQLELKRFQGYLESNEKKMLDAKDDLKNAIENLTKLNDERIAYEAERCKEIKENIANQNEQGAEDGA